MSICFTLSLCLVLVSELGRGTKKEVRKDWKRAEVTAGLGEICNAFGLVASACAQSPVLLQSSFGSVAEFVPITILTLKYPDVSILHVLVLEKQIESVGKQLF